MQMTQGSVLELTLAGTPLIAVFGFGARGVEVEGCDSSLTSCQAHWSSLLGRVVRWKDRALADKLERKEEPGSN